MGGDCYEVALGVLLDFGSGSDAVLCHGVPLGTGGEAKGLRFGHAWVEVGDMVIDRSNGHDVEMPRVLYYAIGNIEPERVRRYNWREAAERALSTEHSGPWHHDPDAVHASD